MIRGAEILLRKGYPQHVVEALPSRARVLPKSAQSGGRPVIVGLASPSDVSIAVGVGLKGRWKGMRGEYEVLEPSFTSTHLTERERIFVLPVERPGGEVISFNPFQYQGEADWARGTYTKPGAPKQVGAIDVRPLTRPEALRVMRQIQSGQEVQLWRYGPRLAQPMSISPERLPMKPSPITEKAVPARQPFKIFPTSPFLALIERLGGSRKQ